LLRFDGATLPSISVGPVFENLLGGIMRLIPRLLLLPLLVLAVGLLFLNSAAQDKAKPDFDMTASYIEACSCDMFCPCYFNTHSTNHTGMVDHTMKEHF